MELHSLTAHQLLDLIAKKKTSPKEVVKDLFKRLDKTDKKVKSLCLLDKKGVLAQVTLGPRNWDSPDAIHFFRNLIQKPWP